MDKMRYLYGQFIETVANGRAVARPDRRAGRRARTRAGLDGRARAVGRPGRSHGRPRRRDRRGGAPGRRSRSAATRCRTCRCLPRAPLGLVADARRRGERRQGASGSAGAAKAGVAARSSSRPTLRAALRMLAPTLLERRHRRPGPAALRHRACADAAARARAASVVYRKFDNIGAWRSLVARLLWEQNVGGSNPAPTELSPRRSFPTVARPIGRSPTVWMGG